jgi:ABC-type branched-subunit amino acid transport system substrate-binding protein
MTESSTSKGGSRAASHALSRRELMAGSGKLALGAATASALGGLSSLVAGPAQAAGFMAKRSFKIGFVGPLTGPVAPEGISLQHGFDLGLEHVNAAGGIAGHPVVAIKQDDQAVPAKTGTIVKKFIQREKVDLILGTITSDEETVASRVAASAGVPLVFIEAGYWEAFCGSTSVLLGETSYELLTPLIPFMVQKFGKRWALVGNDYTFPHAYLGVGKGLLAKQGAKVVEEQYAPLGTADWSSTIAKLKAAKPQVILSAVVGGDAIAFIKQASSLGLLPGTQITGITLQPEFYGAMGKAVDGLHTAVRYTEEINTAANQKFKAAYHKKYGKGPIPLVGSTAYYSLQFIKAAVEKARSYDHKAVMKAFRSGLGVTTMLSDNPLKLDPKTLAVNYPMYICQIQPGGLFKIVKDAGVIGSGLKC